MKFNTVFKNSFFYKILLVLLIFLLVYAVYDYYKYNQKRTEESLKIGFEKLDKVEVIVDQALDTIERTTRELSEDLTKHDYSKKEIEELIKKTTLENKFALGIVAAYKPRMINGKKSLFAPYYSKKTDKIEYIEDSYDYSNDSLPNTQWYTSVIKQKKGIWSNPYISNIIHELVIDYGYPYFKTDANGNKNVAGVISFTIPLTYINSFLHNVSLGRSGFPIITNEEYFLISHPSTEMMTSPKKTRDFLKNNSEIAEVFKKNVQKGHLTAYSYIANENVEYFYTPLHQGWTLSIVMNKNDLIRSTNITSKKIIVIAFLLSLVFIILSIILLKVWEGENKNLWIFSTIIGILLFLNIGMIWYIKINSRYSNNIGETKILSTATINNYIKERNIKLKQIDSSLKSIEIPTGIFIYDMEFLDAYNLAINGKIWQKIPDTLDIKDDINFVFPQAAPSGITVRVRPKLKKHIKDYWLYRADFNATLQFDFNYLYYPLNTRNINIQMKYKNMDDNVVFTPDLKSYDFIQPSLKPGVSSDMYMPNSKVISSYYTFDEHNFYSNLGNEEYKGLKETPLLTFNILLKNVIINPIISNLVPIFIIAIMVFLLPFTVDKTSGRMIEGTSLSLIQAASGFFFVILINHVQLRNDIDTPGMTYLESFYFVMYLMLAVMSTAVLLYIKNNNLKVLEYKQNLIFKISYWPILLLSIYIITLFIFF